MLYYVPAYGGMSSFLLRACLPSLSHLPYLSLIILLAFSYLYPSRSLLFSLPLPLLISSPNSSLQKAAPAAVTSGEGWKEDLVRLKIVTVKSAARRALTMCGPGFPHACAHCKSIVVDAMTTRLAGRMNHYGIAIPRKRQWS